MSGPMTTQRSRVGFKQTLFRTCGGEGTFAFFRLLPPNAKNFDHAETHILRVAPEKDILEQIRQTGLELNGSPQSPRPGLIAHSVEFSTITAGGKTEPAEKDILLQSYPNTVYFGELVPPSPEGCFGEDCLHGLTFPEEGFATEDRCVVRARNGATFDLTTADTVIATNETGTHLLEGDVIYHRGQILDALTFH